MTEQNWNWVEVEDVILAHQQSIAKFGGDDGIRDMGGLNSALAYSQI